MCVLLPVGLIIIQGVWNWCPLCFDLALHNQLSLRQDILSSCIIVCMKYFSGCLWCAMLYLISNYLNSNLMVMFMHVVFMTSLNERLHRICKLFFILMTV